MAMLLKIYKNVPNDDTYIEYGEPVKYVPTFESLGWTYSGHQFEEYNTQSDGSGISYNEGDRVYSNELYVIWEAQSEVTITYKGSAIVGMNASGQKTLTTGGCYCEDDIVVSYTKPSAPTPTLQSKTVSPSTSQQTVSPDTGYDGLSSVTVNAMSVYNGAHHEQVSLISFLIEQTTYQAEEGMTWTQWCASSYNTDAFYIGAQYVMSSDGKTVFNATTGPQSPSYIIDAIGYILISL